MSLSSRQKIVLASGNRGKVNEIQALLLGWDIHPQSDFGVLECEETGSSFVENAIIKARNAALQTGLPAMADDSGLVVDALDGAPGVISARYAGAGASDLDNTCKLLQAMEDVDESQRSSRFICVLVYMRHANDPCPLIAEGSWEGMISRQVLGDNGFGYDPIFWVPEQQCTSAQLPSEVKNALSHRGQALSRLVELIKNKGI